MKRFIGAYPPMSRTSRQEGIIPASKLAAEMVFMWMFVLVVLILFSRLRCISGGDQMARIALGSNSDSISARSGAGTQGVAGAIRSSVEKVHGTTSICGRLQTNDGRRGGRTKRLRRRPCSSLGPLKSENYENTRKQERRHSRALCGQLRCNRPMQTDRVRGTEFDDSRTASGGALRA